MRFQVGFIKLHHKEFFMLHSCDEAVCWFDNAVFKLVFSTMVKPSNRYLCSANCSHMYLVIDYRGWATGRGRLRCI